MHSSGIEVLLQPKNLERLICDGLWITVKIAFISIILGALIGIVLGLMRVSKNKFVLLLNRIYFEAFRVIPTLVWLFIFYFGITAAFNIDLGGETVSILTFTMWGAAEMGDIVRGALQSLPKHQKESAKALGLSSFQIYKYILVPQAVRRMIPGTINLATRMVKTTSLIVLIGVIDVVKVGQQIIESSRFQYPSASFWVYGFIFFLYFIICWPMSKISKYFEKKWDCPGRGGSCNG